MSPSVPLVLAAVLLAPTLAVAQDVDFVRDVQPILQERCFKCHGDKKVEGDLDLSSKKAVFGGDEALWAIVPGDAEGSPVFERVALDQDDTDVMPPEGDKLSDKQIATLRKWIDQGAKWPDDAVMAKTAAPKIEVITVPEPDADTRAKMKAAMTRLGEMGAVAQRIAQNTEAVDVNLSILAGAVNDETVQSLEDLAPATAWLNLSRTKITDRSLGTVARFAELRRLHLARTAVTDAGLAKLSGLAKLEYLNLYGTKVTDAGLKELSGLKALRKLYVWQTGATKDGVAALKAAIPGLHVDLGDYLPKAVAPAAKPANATCPVMEGKAVDPAFTTLHKGQLVGFCCAKCRAAFEKDPKKYEGKLPKLALSPINKTCPVSNQPADAKITSTFEGKPVAFCCEKCKAAFDKNPAKFASKLAAAPELAPEINDVCPVSGQAAKAQIFVDHKGRRVAFCCEKCKAAFVRSPDKYVGKLGKKK